MATPPARPRLAAVCIDARAHAARRLLRARTVDDPSVLLSYVVWPDEVPACLLDPSQAVPRWTRWRTRRGVWTRATIIDAIRAYAAYTGRPPAVSAVRNDEGLPNPSTVARTIGGWAFAIRLAGFTARQTAASIGGAARPTRRGRLCDAMEPDVAQPCGQPLQHPQYVCGVPVCDRHYVVAAVAPVDWAWRQVLLRRRLRYDPWRSSDTAPDTGTYTPGDAQTANSSAAAAPARKRTRRSRRRTGRTSAARSSPPPPAAASYD